MRARRRRLAKRRRAQLRRIQILSSDLATPLRFFVAAWRWHRRQHNQEAQ